MMKWKKTILLTSSFLLVSAASAYAGSNYAQVTAYLNKDIKFTINGAGWIPKDADGNELHPLIYNGSSYLPLKSIAGALGASVNWDSDTETIQIQSVSQNTYGADPYEPYKDSQDYTDDGNNPAYRNTPSILQGDQENAVKNAYHGINAIQKTAALLGVEPSTVWSELQKGNTLAQIAEEKAGWTEETYLAKLLATVYKDIDDAVDAGSLTQAQADTLKAKLEERLKQEIEKSFTDTQNRANQNKTQQNNGMNRFPMPRWGW